MSLYPRVLVASSQDANEEGNLGDKKTNDGDMVETTNNMFEGKSGIGDVIKGTKKVGRWVLYYKMFSLQC